VECGSASFRLTLKLRFSTPYGVSAGASA